MLGNVVSDMYQQSDFQQKICEIRAWNKYSHFSADNVNILNVGS